MDWQHDIVWPVVTGTLSGVLSGLLVAWIVARWRPPGSTPAVGPSAPGQQTTVGAAPKVIVDVEINTTQRQGQQVTSTGSNEDTLAWWAIGLLGGAAAFANYFDALTAWLFWGATFVLALFATAVVALMFTRVRLSRSAWIIYLTGLGSAVVAITSSLVLRNGSVVSRNHLEDLAPTLYLLLGYGTAMLLLVASIWALLGVVSATVRGLSRGEARVSTWIVRTLPRPWAFCVFLIMFGTASILLSSGQAFEWVQNINVSPTP